MDTKKNNNLKVLHHFSIISDEQETQILLRAQPARLRYNFPEKKVKNQFENVIN
jgi:hypothetical protein